MLQPEAEHGAADVLRVILAETGLGSGSGLAGSAKAKGQGYPVLNKRIHTKSPEEDTLKH